MRLPIFQVHPQGRVPFYLIPRLLPLSLLASTGRRNFECSSPSSQLQVGGSTGVLGVPAKQKTGWWRFLVLGAWFPSTTFHMCRRDLLEFPSYTFGSAKAQAFHGLEKMLQQGALELIDQLGPSYYSHLFPVPNLMGVGIS